MGMDYLDFKSMLEPFGITDKNFIDRFIRSSSVQTVLVAMDWNLPPPSSKASRRMIGLRSCLLARWPSCIGPQ